MGRAGLTAGVGAGAGASCATEVGVGGGVGGAGVTCGFDAAATCFGAAWRHDFSIVITIRVAPGATLVHGASVGAEVAVGRSATAPGAGFGGVAAAVGIVVGASAPPA
jgi:hypothetical protein